MNPARASTHGAVTIINATATGRGASLAINGGVSAQWEWTDGGFHFINQDTDDRLARAVHEHAQELLAQQRGATVHTNATLPPARGLKTSSGAAAAMLASAMEAGGQPMNPDDLITACVAVSRKAGVTLTGAFDDQSAVVKGGCRLTDNTAQVEVQAVPTEPWMVAVWVPEHAIHKSQVSGLATESIAARIEHAESLLRAGDVPAAMSENGAAFTALYAEAGLPVTDKPARVAIQAGALGAGLSGTGPAVAALFEPGTDIVLDAVPGGKWVYTEAVAG